MAGNGYKKPDERAWLRGLRTGNGCGAQTVADGVGPTEWLEMDGEKKPLVMSELGCADGWVANGRMAWTADGVGARKWLEMGGRRSRW